MGVKVTNRAYLDVYDGDETNWLLGNVGDWQRLVIDCEASVDYYATPGESVVYDPLNKTFTLNNGKSWSDYGFDIGQSCIFSRKYVNTNEDGSEDITTSTTGFSVVNLYGSSMEINSSFPTPAQGLFTFPSNYGTKRVEECVFYSNIEPEGARIIYGHIPNTESDSGQLNSIIDNTTTMFVRPNVAIQDIAISSAMEAVGMQSGMSVRLATVRRDGFKPGSLNVYRFRFEIQYLISSFFEELSDLENLSTPQYLGGDGSLTDNFKLLFYPKWNNPNTVIQNDLTHTARLGNTGWFNENFNQLVNDFSVDEINYTDENGNVIDALNYYASTKVNAIISGIQNITENTQCSFGFMWIPKYEEDYKEKTTPFYRNTFVNTGDPDNGFNVGMFYPNSYIGGGMGLAWMETKNIKFTNLGNNKLGFEAIFTPTSAFSALFDGKDNDDRKYIIWFSVADQALERNFSDRVSLLADLNDMIKTIPPAGVYPYIQNAFIEHPYQEDAIGVEVYDGFSQDDVLCRLPFQLNPLTTQFRKIRFGVEAYNSSTGARFVLEKQDADLTQYYNDAAGVPQYSLNATRGFKLEAGNNKNWVKINRQPLLDTEGFSGYIAYYAFKIRYEDWLAITGAPNDFFSSTDLNNGFNNEWLHYLRTMGWKINFFTEIDAVVDTQLVQYRNTWNFKFNDYDENSRIQTTHRYYRHSDNTLLNIGTDPATGKPLGVIISNEPTRLEIEYLILDDGTWDETAVYGTHTIEIDMGGGILQMRQLSSVWGFESDNPLKPLPGESHLHITVDGTQKVLTTKCLIDADLLNDASRYRISGRVGCFPNGGQISFGKYEARYDEHYE